MKFIMASNNHSQTTCCESTKNFAKINLMNTKTKPLQAKGGALIFKLHSHRDITFCWVWANLIYYSSPNRQLLISQ